MPRIELSISDIPLESPIQVVHDGFKIVVVRTEQQIFAFEDTCPHAYWPLSQGSFQGGILECPGHGWGIQCGDRPLPQLTGELSFASAGRRYQ